jgi:hypothetical protein
MAKRMPASPNHASLSSPFIYTPFTKGRLYGELNLSFGMPNGSALQGRSFCVCTSQSKSKSGKLMIRPLISSSIAGFADQSPVLHTLTRNSGGPQRDWGPAATSLDKIVNVIEYPVQVSNADN